LLVLVTAFRPEFGGPLQARMPREIGVFSDIWHSHQRLCERGRSTRIHRRLNSQPLAQYFPHAVLAQIEADRIAVAKHRIEATALVK